MLTIILNWIYMLFTCFSIGFFFAWCVEKVFRYSIRRMDSILMSGFIIATVYAQIFSLFYRVNIEANVVLSAVSILICIVMRKRIGQFLRQSIGSASWPRRGMVLLLFFLWSFFASRAYYRVLDMDMYHGQSIRWIEEYGVVKGLGNLHCRFGYNSSIFAVSALYSMRFLLGRSIHAVNGMIAFILCMGLLDLGKAFRRRKMLLSDYARAGAVYYLTTIYDEILAPSSDYAVMCLIFFIIIKWLTILEDGDRQVRDHIAPYGLLCVAGVFALTLKLSAGLLLLLTIKPACMLLKEKRWKETGSYIAMGLAVAVPWMTRTVLITGWLLYPFAGLDLFQVDWKISESIVKTDAYLIKIWAKCANGLADTSLKSWIPYWFQNGLSFTERLLILADIGSGVAVLGLAVFVVVRKRWKELDYLLVMAAVGCSYLYWQFEAPMMRYGYAYVLLLAALAGGYFLEKVALRKAVYFALMLYGAYKLYVCLDYVVLFRTWPNYIWSETYDQYELESYEIGGETFYYSPYGGATGYDPFPSAPTQADLELRGDGMKDGFRMRQ